MARIAKVNDTIFMLHAEGSDLSNPYSDDGEGNLYLQFMRDNAGTGKILIVDLSDSKFVYARQTDSKMPSSGDMLVHISTDLEKHGLGCIYTGLNEQFEEFYRRIGVAKKLSFVPKLDDATAVAEMLQSNHYAKAEWLGSDEPKAVIASLVLQNEIPVVTPMGKGTYKMTVPWKSLHSGHIGALEKRIKLFSEIGRKVGEKRNLILDLNHVQDTSLLLMPALARIEKQLNTRGDSIRLVCADAVLESIIDEHQQTRHIPIFADADNAAKDVMTVGKP